MAVLNDSPKQLSDHHNEKPRKKSRGRRWARWAIGVFGVFGVFGVLAVTLSAAFYWRLPLASAMLRVGLNGVGIPRATFTISALSPTRIRLDDVHLSPELTIKHAEASFDLTQLPGNPFTRITLDGIRSDLTGNDRTLRDMFGSPRDDTTTATLPTPATIQTLLNRISRMPTIAIKNLVLRYAHAGSVMALTGSAKAGSKNSDTYAVRLALQFSRNFAGKAHTVSLESTAHIAKGTMTASIRANTADGTVNGTLTGHTIVSSDQLGMSGKVVLRAKQLISKSITLEETKLNGVFDLTHKDNSLTLAFPKALQMGATWVRLEGKPARRLSLAPFILRLSGTANHQGTINGQLHVPKLSVTEKNRVGVIDDLAITVRQSETNITGNVRGRISALDGDKLLFHPIPVQSDFSLRRDILTFDSKATLPGISVASAKGQHDFTTGKGAVSLALPAFRMTPGGNELRALAPSISGFDIRSGTVRATAELAWDKKSFDGTAAVGIEGINLVDSASGATIQELSADIRLNRIVPPHTAPSQTLRVKRIVAGVTFDDLFLQFALLDSVEPGIPALQIEAFQTLFAGGRLSIAPTVMDSAAASSQAVITVKNVGLTALLAAVGLDGVSGTGRLSGIIPVRMAGKTVDITGGRLSAAGPGVLHIRSEIVKNALSQGGADVTLMLSALEDFRYETLTMKIEKEASGEGRIVLQTRGQNPAVRNGRPFAINLNLSGNVDRLAAVAAQAFQLPGTLVRVMLPR